MEYRGYLGSVEFSEEDGVFFGQVQGTRALISYEGTTAAELTEDFHNAVDDYLELCATQNILPEQPYQGSFRVEISPELHRKAVRRATEQNVSLNRFVENSIRASVG